MNSEYQYCGCEGCFDITVGTLATRSLCGLCDEAGCVIGDTDCQRIDADSECEHWTERIDEYTEVCVLCGRRATHEPDRNTDHGSP